MDCHRTAAKILSRQHATDAHTDNCDRRAINNRSTSTLIVEQGNQGKPANTAGCSRSRMEIQMALVSAKLTQKPSTGRTRKRSWLPASNKPCRVDTYADTKTIGPDPAGIKLKTILAASGLRTKPQSSLFSLRNSPVIHQLHIAKLCIAIYRIDSSHHALAASIGVVEIAG